jgi:hypothetical protein
MHGTSEKASAISAERRLSAAIYQLRPGAGDDRCDPSRRETSDEPWAAYLQGTEPRAGAAKGAHSTLRKPERIYAPDPGTRIGRLGNLSYSYVRPLMTIEPIAIQLAMPVNALIGFKNVGQLRKELLAPENANSVIYLAWEHVYLNQFAKRLLKAYGKDPSLVPDWPDDEYDRIYVFQIKDVGGKKDLTFSVEQQGLTDSLSDKCPAQ